MESYFYGCCAAESITDRHGVTANMGYDFNKRLDWAIIPMGREYGHLHEVQLHG